MYAIIASGGKQYRVAEGEVVRVEKLDADSGAEVQFTDVLLVRPRLGPSSARRS